MKTEKEIREYASRLIAKLPNLVKGEQKYLLKVAKQALCNLMWVLDDYDLVCIDKGEYCLPGEDIKDKNISCYSINCPGIQARISHGCEIH